jgi:Spy/CpxP family protein refolding chaperone
MKTRLFLTILFSLALAASPAWAQSVPAPQQGQIQPAKPGCRMLGGSGMGRGWGMGGGTGRYMGRRAGGRYCMMGGCWGGGTGMGRIGRMGACPGPRQTVRSAFHEINGYQMNADDLGLNEDQLKRLDTIEETLTTTAIKTRADLQIAAIDLRRAMTQETPDTTKAGTLIDQEGKMWTDLQKKAVKAVADARKVLTPEQRQKAHKMMIQTGHRMMRWRSMTPMDQDGNMADQEMQDDTDSM